MNATIPIDPAKDNMRRRRGRNVALFLLLVAFVVLVYGVTIVKIKAGYAP